MKILATILLLTATAQARTVSLVWDAAPAAEQVVGWRIYRGNVLIAATNTNSATVTLDNSAATLTVTAINAAGESPPSAPLPIPVPMLWIQTSEDNVNWRNVVQIPYTQDKQFIRLQLPPQ